MKPNLSRPSLRCRLNQLKIDRAEIKQLDQEMFALQQRKHKLEHLFYLNQASYETDQRAWFEATHPKVISIKTKRVQSLNSIVADMLEAELRLKGVDVESLLS